jgi:hypothetical protein
MLKGNRALRALLTSFLLLPVWLNAAERDQEKSPAAVYGGDLMTPQERDGHRQKLRSAKTTEERQKLRAEYQLRMKERARERGIALPDGAAPSSGGVAPDTRVPDTPQAGGNGLRLPESPPAPGEGPDAAEKAAPGSGIAGQLRPPGGSDREGRPMTRR